MLAILRPKRLCVRTIHVTAVHGFPPATLLRRGVVVIDVAGGKPDALSERRTHNGETEVRRCNFYIWTFTHPGVQCRRDSLIRGQEKTRRHHNVMKMIVPADIQLVQPHDD